MKKLYSTLLFLFTLTTVCRAQFTTDGYYRVQNFASERYIYLTDNTGSYDKTHDIGDLSAIQLWKNRPLVSDPASIIYIQKINNAGEYDLMGQGCGVHAITDMYVHVKETGDNEYNVYGLYQGVAKYLSDAEITDIDEGGFATTGKGDYRVWSIYKVDNQTSNFFGIEPNVSAAGKQYYPLYMAMAFQPTAGMKAYTISKVDQGMAVVKEATGTIPAFTPVLLEMTSTNAADNKLDLLPPAQSGTPLAGNKLKGVLFCNQSRATKDHSGLAEKAITPFDKATMRVLGTTKDGRLGFVSESDHLFDAVRPIDGKPIGLSLPANQAYLPVEAGTPEELIVVTEAEYAAAIEANKTYTLTYEVDGETYATETHKKGDTLNPPTPEKEGYTFTGWESMPATMPAADTVVKGHFVVNIYAATYSVDGQLVHTDSVAYGNTIPDYIYTPESDRYTFTGWQTADGATYTTMPAHDIAFTTTLVDAILAPRAQSEADSAVYDLLGRRLTKAPTRRGLYIKGGHIINKQ